MPDHPTESSVLAANAAALRRSSLGALEEQVVALFDELRAPLLRYLSAFPLAAQESEDVIQEAFLALFQHLRAGKSHSNVRGWLFRAAHNIALKNSMRAKKREQFAAPGEFDNSIADPSPSAEDQLERSRRQKRLMSVVRALPEQSRWCLYLRAEGLRYREIAEVLNISAASVAVYLERSLALMARAVER